MVAVLVPNGAVSIFDENAPPPPPKLPPGDPDFWPDDALFRLDRRWEQWITTTYKIGTPVIFTGPVHGMNQPGYGLTTIEAGSRGEVVPGRWGDPAECWPDRDSRGECSVRVRLTDVVDQSGQRVVDLVGKELNIEWQKLQPLVDNWATPPAPAYSRYTLPRSQRYGLLKPNAAMDMHLGRELSEEQRGARASSLRPAEKRYRVFHKKEPRRLVELPPHVRFPEAVGLAGDCESVSYRTDKWHADGRDTDYKHVDEPGVKIYHQRGAYPWLKDATLPVEYPDVLVLLGKHLGYYLRRIDDQEIYEATPRGTYLFCAPSGKLLCVLHPRDGILALMAGGRLSVQADGIEG